MNNDYKKYLRYSAKRYLAWFLDDIVQNFWIDLELTELEKELLYLLIKKMKIMLISDGDVLMPSDLQTGQAYDFVKKTIEWKLNEFMANLGNTDIRTKIKEKNNE